jgi:hypothetical protein
MKKTIKVIYEGKQDDLLDSIILKAMYDAGFKWYAQGFDLIGKERDLCFDRPSYEKVEELHKKMSQKAA